MKTKLFIAISTASLLSGCFNSDDDPAPVTPLPENRAPIAVDAMFITQTDIVVDDVVSGTDPDNDTLTYALAADAANGTVMVNASGDFVYTPNSEFVGEDSFTFTVTDPSGADDEGTVSITVEVLTVLFSDLSRDAFAQQENAKPLSVNGRDIINDVEDPTAFDDLLID